MLIILCIHLQLDSVITSILSGHMHMYITKDFTLTVTLVRSLIIARGTSYTSMNEILSRKDWHTLLDSSSIEENLSAFKNLLSNLVDRFIPKVKITQSRTGVPWWSNALSKAIEKTSSL